MVRHLVKDTHMKTKSDKELTQAPAPAETKKLRFIALLGRPDGATVADISADLGWLPHTTRAMLTGLRKQGKSIGKTKVDGLTRYSLAVEPAS